MKKQIIRLLVLSTALSTTIANADPDGEISGGGQQTIGLQYPDADAREFLKAVLKSLDLPFFERKGPEGETVYWHSSSREQEQEIRNRVSQYMFVTRACKGLPAPDPRHQARKALSCKQ